VLSAAAIDGFASLTPEEQFAAGGRTFAEFQMAAASGF
jgi:hypothetical protein